MADFSTEHKEEQGNYFDEGIHEVVITKVEGGVNDNEKEYIEFTVEGTGGEEGTAKMWFTTDKAIKYTFNSVRAIFVHNALDGKEEAARDMVNKTKNSEELIALCNKILIGKTAFYQVEKSDYTYTNAAGEQKQGYNRNITGYKPKAKVLDEIDQVLAGAKDVTGEVPDVF